MTQFKNYIWTITIAMLVTALYACDGSAASNNKLDSTTINKPADKPIPAIKHNTANDEQAFRLFFKSFKNAVKGNNRAQIVQKFNFPLQTLPQWTNDDIKSNQVDLKGGLITSTEFEHYYSDIFTNDVIKIIPAAKEDDLSEIDKTTTENYYLTLMQVTDKGSTLYELEKQYSQDNGKETSFGFVFGKVKGAYKVISYYRPWPLK